MVTILEDLARFLCLAKPPQLALPLVSNVIRLSGTSASMQPRRAFLVFNDPRPNHFFSSSLSLGAGRSVVFFSLSHQSFQNFSSSRRFFSLACLSSRRESIVANHSSRAASCSSRVAYWFMQLFIAFCCVRHAKVAVKVLLVQHAAKSMTQLLVCTSGCSVRRCNKYL